MDIESIIADKTTLKQHFTELIGFMKSNKIFNVEDLEIKLNENAYEDISYIYNQFKEIRNNINDILQQFNTIKNDKLYGDYGISEEEVNKVIFMCKEEFELKINQEIDQKPNSNENEISLKADNNEICVNSISNVNSENDNSSFNLLKEQENSNCKIEQNNDHTENFQLLAQVEEQELHQSNNENDIEQMEESFIKYLKYLEYHICVLLSEAKSSIERENLYKQKELKFQEIWIKINDYFLKNGIANFDQAEKLKNSLYNELFVKFKIKESLNIISKIKSKVIPLDIKKLKFYYEKSILAAEKIKEKDVVALLGNSNAGKSTTTFYIAGSEMKQTLINGKIPHIFADKYFYKELDDIKTSYKALSETRYVVAFQINYDDLKLKEKGSIYIADLPGLFENRDIETEISNNLGVTRFLKACKTLKILYVLNYKDMVANNCQGVRDLIHVIISLVGSVDDSIDKFLFAINKANKNEFEELKERIMKLEGQLTEDEQNDQPFQRALSLIADRIDESSLLINPLNKADLEKIHRKIKQCKPFKNPGEVFKLTLSPNAKSVLKDYVSAKENFILNALEKSDKSFLINQINELSFFNKIEEMNDLQSNIDEIYDMISINLDANYNKMVKIFNDIKNNNNIFNQDLIKEVDDLFRKIEKFDDIRSFLPDDKKNLFKFSDAKKFIEDFIKEINIIDLPKDEQLDYTFFSNLNKKFTNIYLLTNTIKEFINEYFSFYKQIKEKVLKNFLEEYRINFLEFKYEECYRYFHIIKNLDNIIIHFSKENSDISHFKNFNLEFNFHNKHETELSEKLKTEIRLILEKNIEIVCEIFLNEKFILTREKIDEIKNSINRINLINESRISDLFDKAQLREANEKIALAAKSYIHIRNENINSMIISDEKLKIDDLINDYETLKLISEIEKISFYLWETYKKTCEILGTILIKIKNSYKTSFESIIFSNNDYFLFKKNINNICIQIRLIENSKLLHILDPNFKEKFFTEMKDEFENYIKDSLNSANYGNGISFNDNYLAVSVLCFGKLSIINETEISKFILKENNLQNEIINLEKKLEEFLNNQIKTITEEDLRLNIKLFKFSFQKRIFYLEIIKKITSGNLVNLIGSFESTIHDSAEQFKKLIFSSIKDMIDLFNKKNFTFDSIQKDLQIIKLGYKCIKEIEEIKLEEQFNYFYSILNSNKDFNLELIKTSIFELKQYLNKIIQNNRIHIDINLLRNVIEVLLENLIQFDRLILICYHQFTFSKLYELCNDLMKDSLPSVQIRDKDKIINKDYPGLVESFEEINADLNNPMNQRRQREIIFEINIVIRNTKDKIFNLLKIVNPDYIKEENIKEIEEHSQILNNIKFYLEKFINIDEISRTEEFTLNKIKILFENMKKQIEGYYSINQFANAENVLKKLYNYTNILNSVKLNNIDFDEITKTRQNLIEKIKNSYKDEDIMRYRLVQPKKLFEQLNKDDILNNVEIMCFYKTFREELINIIEHNYNQKIDKIINEDGNPNEKEYQLQELEKSTDYLPDEIKKYQLDQIIRERKNLDSYLLNLEKSIDEMIKNRYSKEINDKYRQNWPSSLKQRVEKYLINHSKELYQELEEFEKIKENSDPKKFRQILLKNFEFYSNMTNFKNLLSKFETQYKKKFDQIIKEICKAEKEIFNLDNFKLDSNYQFDNSEDSDFSISSPNLIYLNLNQYLNFFKELILLLKEEPKLVEELASELQTQIISSLNKTEKSLIKLDEMNLNLLNQEVICSQSFLNIYRRVKEFYSSLKFIFDDQVKEFLKTFQREHNSHILEKISKFKSPEERKKELQEQIDEYKKDIYDIRSKVIFDEKSRQEFFRLLNPKINTCKVFFNKFDPKKNIPDEIDKKLDRQIRELVYGIEEFDISKEENIKDSKLKEINLNFIILNEFSQTLLNYKDYICESIKHVKSKIIKNLDQERENILESELNLNIICEKMTKSKRIGSFLNYFEKEIDLNTADYIDQLKTRDKSGKIINILGQLLQDKGEFGIEITRMYKIFDGNRNFLYKSQTDKFGIDYVLDNVQFKSINDEQVIQDDFNKVEREFLKAKYDEFMEEFKLLVEKHLRHSQQGMTDIKNKLQLLISEEIKKNRKDKMIPNNLFQDLPKILAHICAIFTINGSKNYYNLDDTNFENKNLMIPHPAQIIAVFELFCLNTKNSKKVRNNMVQVGTGEGKSIILGITSILFALLGYEVSVACYSNNLSMRDYDSFKDLFDFFGISKYIHYGNLYNLMEMILNKDVNLKNYFTEIIFKNNENIFAQINSQRKFQVLLFDEIDVFFSKEFHGKIYSSCLLHKHPTINDLFKFIWNNRSTVRDEFLKLIKESSEYNQCKEIFNNWGNLLDENIKDILNDLSNFESHQYLTVNNKIGYKDNDEIVYNRRIGYKTVFAYFKEHEKDKITADSLEENIGITIKCSDFSFTETPKMFDYIFGVSGTVNNLGLGQKKMVAKEYDIRKYTILPSVFGKNNLQFNKYSNFFIECDENYDLNQSGGNVQYFFRIKEEINKGLIGHSSGKPDRAVIIFFKDLPCLNQYLSENKLSRKDFNIMSEDLNRREIQDAIKTACRKRVITLATASFGRGYDFIIDDQLLNSEGGLHVIQTFFSYDMAEQIQIRGRTARQGKSGTYCLIVKFEELKDKFEITKEKLDQQESKYDFVMKIRDVKNEILFNNDQNIIGQIQIIHKESIKLLEFIKNNKIDEIKKQILKINKGVNFSSFVARTKIYLDATGSMEVLIEKLKFVVNTIFINLTKILKEKEISENSFSIEIVLFRNYDVSKEDILVHSGWEMKPDNLINFLTKSICFGGWGKEAIELCLNDAFNETKNITNIIIFSDSASNTKELTQLKRSATESYKENGQQPLDYWNSTQFKHVIDIEQELSNVENKKIPIYGFYVENKEKSSLEKKEAETFFKRISHKNNGLYEKVNVENEKEGIRLFELISKPILSAIGDSTGNSKLKEDLLAALARVYV